MAKEYVPYTGAVVTRAEARTRELTRFFTGKPCKHGHFSERSTCNGGCIACNAITNIAMYRVESPEKRQRRLVVTLAWIELHKEERLAYGRDYARANRAKHAAWKVANKDQVNALARAARAANPGPANARATRYSRSPKGKLNGVVGGRRRRARRFAAEGSFTSADVLRIGVRQKWKCHWCAKPTKRKYEVDHIVPLSKGGTNWPSNLAISCPRCNRRKSATDPIEYARRKGLLI
jgi:5-methylcytosine-specific restriction endonuclease McrA